MKSIEWKHDHLLLLDQRKLPHETTWFKAETVYAAAEAIEKMIVRGAPAIAITAAYGMSMAIRQGMSRTEAHTKLLATRPTAVNLRWALDRLLGISDEDVLSEAKRIHEEDLAINLRIGANGAHLLKGNIITICNTGALATGGHGTALGMIRSAFSEHGDIHVFALETRPYLQGARLTVYECMQEQIPCTLITDGMAGALMQKTKISAVVFGCDRVARNGDTANKIGSYSLSVLAKHHNIPVYVAMPRSTFDPHCSNGASIEIEERSPTEVRSVQGHPIAPHDVPVWNPGFDVTPADLIEAWISEEGVTTSPNQLV
jgi:methylthioribose-1-phosphate isomerase